MTPNHRLHPLRVVAFVALGLAVHRSTTRLLAPRFLADRAHAAAITNMVLIIILCFVGPAALAEDGVAAGDVDAGRVLRLRLRQLLSLSEL